MLSFQRSILLHEMIKIGYMRAIPPGSSICTVPISYVNIVHSTDILKHTTDRIISYKSDFQLLLPGRLSSVQLTILLSLLHQTKEAFHLFILCLFYPW